MEEIKNLELEFQLKDIDLQIQQIELQIAMLTLDKEKLNYQKLLVSSGYNGGSATRYMTEEDEDLYPQASTSKELSNATQIEEVQLKTRRLKKV